VSGNDKGLVRSGSIHQARSVLPPAELFSEDFHHRQGKAGQHIATRQGFALSKTVNCGLAT